MARNQPAPNPLTTNDRIGLMTSRLQGITLGHGALMSQMTLDNSRNIMGIGSTEKSGVPGNPMSPEQRRMSLQGLCGDAFKIIFLRDIGSTDRSTDWVDYVLSRIESAGMPAPTDFYSGSKHDARWYQERFASLESEPSYRRGAFDVWESEDGRNRIHILDRTRHVPISASEVRSLIEQRDPTWRNFVPARLWNFYEWEYPPELRVALDVEDPNMIINGDPKRYPVGTKLVGDGGEILILRDDGKWRVRTAAENAKSMGD